MNINIEKAINGYVLGYEDVVQGYAREVFTSERKLLARLKELLITSSSDNSDPD